MSVKLDLPEPYDPNRFKPREPFDWAGRWRNRHEEIIRQGADTHTGERQWIVRCGCGSEFSCTESQLSDSRVILCPQGVPRNPTGRSYWTNRTDTLTNWRR